MKEFETKSPFPSSGHSVKELTRNFRSRKKILDFNEKVFKEKLLKSEYSDAAQKSGLTNYNQEVKDRGTDAGYMEVCMIDKSDNYNEKEKIRTIICEAVKRGYCYGDIAVLTSKNENVIRVSALERYFSRPLESPTKLILIPAKSTPFSLIAEIILLYINHFKPNTPK